MCWPRVSYMLSQGDGRVRWCFTFAVTSKGTFVGELFVKVTSWRK